MNQKTTRSRSPYKESAPLLAGRQPCRGLRIIHGSVQWRYSHRQSEDQGRTKETDD